MHDNADNGISQQAPDFRRIELARRLSEGRSLVLAELAREFGISVDTARRDLAALEARGTARRIRGGAVPAAIPAAPLRDRRREAAAPDAAMIGRALAALAGAGTLLLDGGTTVAALARRLTPAPGLLVITPAPVVAAITHDLGIETQILGGPVSLQGGIATGPGVIAALDDVAAEVAVLGACGLEAEFGLSSDDLMESAVKRAMGAAAGRRLVLTGAAKLGLRARHRTLRPDGIDLIVTDAGAEAARPFIDKDIAVSHD